MRLLYSAALLALPLAATAQDTNCDPILSSQAEVDAFDCTHIASLDIYGGQSGIENLHGLSELTTIDDYLALSSHHVLPNLDGLESLTYVGGDLILYETSLENLDGLQSLTTVGGWLELEDNYYLTDLDGLQNLETVRTLTVANSYLLRDVEALSSLLSVESITIAFIDSLRTLEGFRGLTEVAGNINIVGNETLESLEGFRSLTTLGGDLYVHSNASLDNLDGLRSLTSVDGYLEIVSNASLRNVDGLAALASVGTGYFPDEGLIFWSNPVLERCAIGLGPILTAEQEDPDAVLGGFRFESNGYGLPDGAEGSDCNSVESILAAYDASPFCPPTDLDSQQAVDGFACGAVAQLTISGSDVTNLDALSGLTTVAEDLVISGTSLESLSGLENLTAVGASLRIAENAALTSVGLDALTSVGADLLIRENGALTDLDPLAQLASVGGDLTVGYNAALARCAPGLGPLLTAEQEDPATVGGDKLFEANGTALSETDCNAEADILAAYAVAAEEGPGDLAAALAVFPNPATGPVTVRFALPAPAAARVTVHDLLGREVLRLSDGAPASAADLQFDAGALAPGLYVVRLVTESRVETARLAVAR